MVKSKCKIVMLAVIGLILSLVLGVFVFPPAARSVAAGGENEVAYSESDLDDVTVSGDKTVQAEYRDVVNLIDFTKMSGFPSGLKLVEKTVNSIGFVPFSSSPGAVRFYFVSVPSLVVGSRYEFSYNYSSSNGNNYNSVGLGLAAGGIGVVNNKCIFTASESALAINFGISDNLVPADPAVSVTYSDVTLKEVDDTRDTRTITFNFLNFQDQSISHIVEIDVGEKVFDHAPISIDTKSKLFVMWQGVTADTVVTEPMTITAQYTFRTYDVTFSYLTADGVETSSCVVYEHGTLLGNNLPVLADVVGRTFSGWDLPVDGRVTSVMTVTAQYVLNDYTITFKYLDSNGVEKTEEKTLAYDTVLTLYMPELPVLSDKHFTGWTLENGDSVPGTVPGNDLTIVANYEINTYIVTFVYLDGNGAEKTETKIVEHGTRLLDILPEVPAVAGKVFAGWNVSDTVRVVSDVRYLLSIDDNGIVTPKEGNEPSGANWFTNAIGWILNLGQPYSTLLFIGVGIAVVVVVGGVAALVIDIIRKVLRVGRPRKKYYR